MCYCFRWWAGLGVSTTTHSYLYVLPVAVLVGRPCVVVVVESGLVRQPVLIIEAGWSCDLFICDLPWLHTKCITTVEIYREREEIWIQYSGTLKRQKQKGRISWYLLSLTSLWVMLYRAEKPSLATAMSVWKDRERIPVDDWISGGTMVPQYRPIRGPTVNQTGQNKLSVKVMPTSTWSSPIVLLVPLLLKAPPSHVITPPSLSLGSTWFCMYDGF